MASRRGAAARGRQHGAATRWRERRYGGATARWPDGVKALGGGDGGVGRRSEGGGDGAG